MPALAALAEARLPGSVTDGLPGLASFRAAYPGYGDTTALDALRTSEYWYLDAEGQTYLDYTGARSSTTSTRPRTSTRRERLHWGAEGAAAFPP